MKSPLTHSIKASKNMTTPESTPESPAESLREGPLALMGTPGSPYTRKMLALLRYRRIPYRLMPGSHRLRKDLPRAKVELLPTFYFPNDAGGVDAVVDSTPIIRRLEGAYPGRHVVPEDAALAFLDYLLEDYADEWLTKAMFHYRWGKAPDIEKGANILTRYAMMNDPTTDHQKTRETFGKRQTERLYVVGSNPTTAPVIEASYCRFMAAFEAHLQTYRFAMGHRPGASDFAIHGQLTQLARFDPTSMEIAIRIAPTVSAWVEVSEDLSGLSPTAQDWTSPDALPETLKPIFAEIGRLYVPVMLANARALAAGAAKVETEVDGKPWVQDPFPYQGRCVQWVRGEYQKLSAADKARIAPLLAETGCDRMFA